MAKIKINGKVFEFLTTEQFANLASKLDPSALLDYFKKTEVQAELDKKEDKTDKGEANGYASLDGGGKVPVEQLPKIDTFPTGGTTGQVLKKTSTGVAWEEDKDTTYDAATPTTDGLMSSADKTKINGVEAGAQKNTITSVQGRTGAVVISKLDVGLDNVNNVAITQEQVTKLDGVETGAQKNTVTSVNGQTGAVIVTDTTYTAGTNISINTDNQISSTDTTYGLASASANGLMSSAMFGKLNAMPGDSVMRIIVLNQASYDALSTVERAELIQSTLQTGDDMALGKDIKKIINSNVEIKKGYHQGKTIWQNVYLAQDSDFVKVSGYWVYRGAELEIEIPTHINGNLVTSTYRMFSGDTTYRATPVTKVVLNHSNVTYMRETFYKSKATTLDLSGFNTSNVTNMIYMFRYSSTTTLDLSGLDTSNVTDMGWMFQSSPARTGYARTQADANKFNASEGKPAGLNFVVKP